MLATTAAARSLLARTAARSSTAFATTAVRSFASLEPYADYGKSVFTGRVADEYLKKHGASGDILDDPSWTQTHSDTVAKAVLDWYVSTLLYIFVVLLLLVVELLGCEYCVMSKMMMTAGGWVLEAG